MSTPSSDVISRLKSPDVKVRQTAIQEVQALASPDAPIMDALNVIATVDPDTNLRGMAAQALTQIRAKSGIAVPANAGMPAQPSVPQSAPHSAQQPGKKTFQMLWDCRFCGTTKLLGMDNRHCPNCGAAQDPSWRYFPSEADKKFIDNPKYAGVDKICPFCGQPNSAEAKFCKDCGGDLTGAKDAARKETLVTGLEGAAGVRDDMVLKQFQAEQAAIKGGKPASAAVIGAKPAKKRSILPIIGVIILGAIIAVVGGLVVLSKITHDSELAVTDMNWAAKIDVQRYAQQSGSDWQDSVPSDAYNLSCSSQQRCHNEDQDYVCGSVNQDNGDGSGSSIDKHCTRSVQVCVDDNMCHYTVDRWVADRTLTSGGGVNDTPQCPPFTSDQSTVLGAERGTCVQSFNVIFTDTTNSKNIYTLSQNDPGIWAHYKIGQVYNAKINALNVPLWDSLNLK